MGMPMSGTALKSLICLGLIALSGCATRTETHVYNVIHPWYGQDVYMKARYACERANDHRINQSSSSLFNFNGSSSALSMVGPNPMLTRHCLMAEGWRWQTVEVEY